MIDLEKDREEQQTQGREEQEKDGEEPVTVEEEQLDVGGEQLQTNKEQGKDEEEQAVPRKQRTKASPPKRVATTISTQQEQGWAKTLFTLMQLKESKSSNPLQQT